VLTVALLGCAALAIAETGRSTMPGSNGRIAFESLRDGNREVYSMEPDGTDQRNLTANPAREAEPAWSPDGSQLAFVSNRDGNNEIYVMNADGTAQTRLTTNPAGELRPTWSPDGSKIAFSTDRDGNGEIYVMNADGTGQTNLTANGAADAWPSWSPDGTRIAFTRGNDIYVMNAVDGSGQVNLTNTPSTSEILPDWSPDGSRIAFVQPVLGGIEVMAPDGTGRTSVPTPGNLWTLDGWSPDGTKFLLTLAHAQLVIGVMKTDGTGLIVLTATPTNDQMGSWQPVRDTTPPVLRLPADIVVQASGPDGATVSFNVDATDDVDGPVAVTCEPSSGSRFPLGTTIVSCSASDSAGNRATGTFTVTVLYGWAGFFRPIENGVINVANSGSTIPIKFSLGGDQGLSIFFSDEYPNSATIPCSASLDETAIEEYATNSVSGLKYDAGNDQYIYTWKTERAWKGTCRQLIIRLRDGTYHRANFRFTK